MSNYAERINAALGVALRRQYLSPLDVSSVFKSMEDFTAYVTRNAAYSNAAYSAKENEFLQKINPYSYPGQVVAVLDEANSTAKAYIINKCGALEEGENIADRYSEVGKSIDVDTKTIQIKNGVLMLAGIENVPAERTKAYQPTLDANGKLVWSPVSETTVEGLQTLVSALQERVSAIEGKEDAWDGAVTDVAAIKAKYIKEVAYEESTGVFTFTLQDGTTKVVDLAIEKVVTNFEYDEESKSLILTLADGTKQMVPMTAFIDDYTVEENALQIQLAITNDNVISAAIVDGAVTEAKLSSAVNAKLAQIQDGVDAKAALADKADKLVVDGLVADNTTNKAGISELKTSVATKVDEDAVKVIIAGESISGSKVTGAVANATKAATADTANKTVGSLTISGKDGTSKKFDGSAEITISAEDLGALTDSGELTIKVGETEVATSAGNAKETVKFVAGDRVSIVADAETKEIKISADEAPDNRRAIRVNGEEKLGVESKGALNIVAGENVTVTAGDPDENGNVSLTIKAADTKYTAGTGITISEAKEVGIAAKAITNELIADNTIEDAKIKSVNVNKLVQTDGDILILNGGQA